jgi:hypothetical protein
MLRRNRFMLLTGNRGSTFNVTARDWARQNNIITGRVFLGDPMVKVRQPSAITHVDRM